ncbi:DUF58 domain-containing protein [Agromyces atrinae]|uniref:DUF58 domain-containing protein n=1 Tax=Agromyces atrinae TaxID=592376 RepID=A0A4Q2M5B7_9MICO|nr:DUF58 domain-containing protein [Agromyces atrinae]NYD66648.1 uncharacterized protein (DUF58 family) [Agromyces atrinae]RXZ87314.1 DUF58 domain-containing protein [Agromyces atrinae]
MAVSGWFVLLITVGLVPLVAGGADQASAWWIAAGWIAACIALGIIDLSLAASPRQVTVERRLPARVRLGESIESELFLTNSGARRMRALVRDAWQPSAGIDRRGRRRVDLPPGERRVLSFSLTPARRGERRVAVVAVRSWGPLRLWARQADLSAPGRIRVLPPFLARKHLPSRLARLRELEGRTPVMVRGNGTEFDSIREYVRGDDVRSIDWRATARAADPTGGQRLMVRTWRPERDRRIVIITDTARSSAARIADEPRLDTSFEASLLLAALASHAGDRVDFLAWDRRVRGRVSGSNGPELLSRLVDTMASIESEIIEPDWSSVPAQVRSITSRHALVIVLTSIDSPGATRSLLAMLPQLTARHTVIVASVTDPSLDTAVRDLSDRESTYLAAAAERASLDVERVASAVRRLGAHVVTAAPADLPPALSDRYLDLKAAGLL